MLRRLSFLAACFLCMISAAAHPAARPEAGASWSGVPRVVAVGDIHGDYDGFVRLLQDAQVINKKTDWSAGKAHLVQIGDVPDRGPHPRKIMDLLMKLERQAQKAGGCVHALIGNHDAMNIYGDLRYTTPEEYAEFRDSRSKQVREAFYEQTVAEMRKQAESKGMPVTLDDEFRKKWEAEHPLGFFEHRYAYGPNGKYGKWIRSHNVAIRINNTLFVHGGIGPKYADVSIEVINETIRKELADFSALNAGLARDSEGPLWYRGLADGDEQELAGHVETVLRNLGVNRIVVGHTTTKTTIIPRFGCKVIMADVGLSKVYGGPPACLVIEADAAYALHRGKMLKIPCDSGKELLEYLRSAAALDPSPSPIEKLILELEKKLVAALLQ
jgi:hypothetical protein